MNNQNKYGMKVEVDNIEKLRGAIVNVLRRDGRAMPFNVLRYKTFSAIRKVHKDLFIDSLEFDKVLEDLVSKNVVGFNRYGKYYIDYLDYEETDVGGEGFIEVDTSTGNGYITVKQSPTEFKKSSHFVHHKNLLGAKTGDYVRFCELKITNKKHLFKSVLIDAKVKEILLHSQTSEDNSETLSKEDIS